MRRYKSTCFTGTKVRILTSEELLQVTTTMASIFMLSVIACSRLTFPLYYGELIYANLIYANLIYANLI
jgi:hypothetical protein